MPVMIAITGTELTQKPEYLLLLVPVAIIGFVWLVRWARLGLDFRTLLFFGLLVILGGASTIPVVYWVCKSYLRWIALFLVAGASLTVLLSGRRRSWTPVHWGFVGFLAYAGVTSAISIFPLYSLERVLSLVLVFLGAFIAVWAYLRHERDLARLLEMYYRIAALLVPLGFVLLLVSRSEVLRGGRFGGFFSNQNGLGMFCAIFLPIVLWRTYYAPARMQRIWAQGLLGLTLLSLVMTGSRGSMAGGFAGLLAGQARLDFRKVWIWAMALAAAAVLVVFVGLGRTEIATWGTQVARADTVGTLTHRTDMWREAIVEFKRHPFFGIGFGNSRFVLLTEEERERSVSEIGAAAENLHSQHVDVLIDLGVVGAAFLWTFMAYFLFRGFGCYFAHRGFTADTRFLIFCSIFAVFLDTFLSGWLYSAGSMFCLAFWILVVAFLACDRLERDRARRGAATGVMELRTSWGAATMVDQRRDHAVPPELKGSPR